jgi:hypothetical protein
MKSPNTIQQTARRIKLLSAVAAVVAYPAALGFAWLWLIEGHPGGLLGFALIWLLGAAVIIRVYAQFLRLWHSMGYSTALMKAPTVPPPVSYPPAAMKAPTVPPPRTLTARAGPSSAIPVATEGTGVRGPSALTSAATSPRREGKKETDEWQEWLQKEWSRAEAKQTAPEPARPVQSAKDAEM